MTAHLENLEMLQNLTSEVMTSWHCTQLVTCITLSQHSC